MLEAGQELRMLAWLHLLGRQTALDSIPSGNVWVEVWASRNCSLRDKAVSDTWEPESTSVSKAGRETFSQALSTQGRMGEDRGPQEHEKEVASHRATEWKAGAGSASHRR